jgi:molecular chaperone GrpE
MTQEEEPIVDKRAASRMPDDAAKAEEAQAETHEKKRGSKDGAAELAAEREKAETYYRNWQRSAADFINYKRRIEQERGESARFAGAALVINLLPVYDDLDRAVSTVDANLAGLNWVQGVMAIHKKFSQLLQAMGVTEVAAAGEQFDPALHEAISSQSGPEGKVLHVVQKGYALSDKVIRPAMVIVGDGSEATN